MVTNGAEYVVSELQRLLREIDGLLKSVINTAGAPGSAAVERLQGALGRLREQLADAEEEVVSKCRQQWRSTDRYVRDNAWMAIGLAAAVGFVAGKLAIRRE